MTEYHIIELTSDRCEQLAVYANCSDAFDNAKYFTSVYDNGCIEIVSTEELIALQHVVNA